MKGGMDLHAWIMQRVRTRAIPYQLSITFPVLETVALKRGFLPSGGFSFFLSLESIINKFMAFFSSHPSWGK